MLVFGKVKKKDKIMFRVTIIQLLENRLRASLCDFEKERCRYCIEIMKCGYKEHFGEVFEFLGIECKMTGKKDTNLIRRVLRMYEEIETMSPSCHTYKFTGFKNVSQHAYYMFLNQYGKSTVKCENFNPKYLNEYEKYLERYEELEYPVNIDSLKTVFESKQYEMM
ncbi:hypothetical protein [Phocicoccus schoeneichii]|uniref:hypothetical protein n=1 Tax=Phocicoccus schoeneichii TaxID=1812261 RepID=UPI003D11F3D5